MPNTTVYLIRHAHAEWGPDEARPLSPAGTIAAAALGKLLSRRSVAAIYTSPSRRARDTVKPLADVLNLDPIIVDDLRERELLPVPADQFEAAVEETWRFPQGALPGSESNAAAQGRALAAIQRIVNGHPGQAVVISTHGTLLTLILNGLDASYGFEFWRKMSFPDLYEVELAGDAITRVVRLWDPL